MKSDEYSHSITHIMACVTVVILFSLVFAASDTTEKLEVIQNHLDAQEDPSGGEWGVMRIGQSRYLKTDSGWFVWSPESEWVKLPAGLEPR